MKQISEEIIYYDDEDLDHYKGTPSNCYKDDDIDVFRDILYTLKKEEIEDWLISLEKREVRLPEILYPEVLDLIS